MTARNYGLITDPAELQGLVDSFAGKEAIGFDVETGYTGPDRDKGSVRPHETAFVAGFSITADKSMARYIPIRHQAGPNMDPDTAWEIVGPVLSEGERVVAHNAKFEVRAMRKEGIELSLRSDTMLEAFLLARYKELGLKSLVDQCFGHKQAEIATLFVGEDGKKPTAKFLKSLRFDSLPSDRPDVVSYACEDAAWCLALHEMHYEPALAIARPKGATKSLFHIDMAILHILADMEDWGVCVDWEALARSREEGARFAERYEEIVRKGLDDMLKAHRGPDAGIDAFKAKKDKRFNLGSTKQLATLLFDTEEGLGLPPVKYTDSGNPSTDNIALNALSKSHEPIKMLLKLREVWNLTKRHDKWMSDYTGAADGRVHASYGQTVVASARFNASDPAIQQVPKKWKWSYTDPEDGTERSWSGNFRSYIVAEEGWYYLGYDYSQIELRFMAGLARETSLLEAFNRGDDVHTLTAAMMLGKPVEEVDPETERPIGKTMNFALLYQMGVKSLADRLGVSKERAQELYDGYFQGFPAIASWQARVTREGKERGGTVDPFGRIATVWELASSEHGYYAKGERMLVNIPVQGGAADYMRIAMVRARTKLQNLGWWGSQVRLVINLHDALTFEVRNDLHPQQVLDALLPAVEFPVNGMPRMRSDWEIGQSWGSATTFDYEDVEFEYVDGRWGVVGSDDPQPVDDPVDDEDELDEEALELEDEEEILPEPEPVPQQDPVLIIEVVNMPFRAQWDRFLTIIGNRPGDVPVRLKTPEGEADLPQRTDMTPADASRVAVCLPGSRVYYPAGSVDVMSLGEGLAL